MTEGQLVMITGEMPKGLENSGRIGTLLWKTKAIAVVLLPDGNVYKGPSYSVIEEQIQGA